jgi:hypothetical protein
MLEHATKRGITLAELHAELAKMETEKQISAADNMVKLHTHHVPGAAAMVRQQEPRK